MTAEQLDLWGDEPVLSRDVPGIGRVLLSPAGGWRARWTGHRYGWQLDRAITWPGCRGWEPWEPDLPYGMEHVLDRDYAVSLIAGLVARHGDDPRWLERRRRPLRAVPA